MNHKTQLIKLTPTKAFKRMTAPKMKTQKQQSHVITKRNLRKIYIKYINSTKHI